MRKGLQWQTQAESRRAISDLTSRNRRIGENLSDKFTASTIYKEVHKGQTSYANDLFEVFLEGQSLPPLTQSHLSWCNTQDFAITAWTFSDFSPSSLEKRCNTSAISRIKCNSPGSAGETLIRHYRLNILPFFLFHLCSLWYKTEGNSLFFYFDLHICGFTITCQRKNSRHML